MQRTKVVDGTSIPVWAMLEAIARTPVQGFIQQLLEDDVTALLGRRKSERRGAMAAPFGALLPELYCDGIHVIHTTLARRAA